MSSVQPSRYSYTGVAWWKSDWSYGISSKRRPPTSYATATGIRSRPVSTSSLVTTRPVRPFTRAAHRTTTASYQPVRRGRPAGVPNSPPVRRSHPPSSSSSSVGKGPSPTRAVHALATAATRSLLVGPTPEPVHAPPAVADEDVTNG